jgi:hypothetical protein
VSPAATRRRELCVGAVAEAGSQVAAGDTRRSRSPAKALRAASVALVAACCLLGGAGCGGGEGAAEGATVSVYVAASLCSEAKSELVRDGGRAGDVHVRIVCLPRAESSRKLNLAQIGANARRATEDSSSIGYIGEPTRAASRFSEPILETAGIAQLPQISGSAAMRQLLRAVSEADDSGSLRESVRDKLE